MKNKYLFYMVAFLAFGLADLLYLNSKVIPALWPDEAVTAKMASTKENPEEPDNHATRQANPSGIKIKEKELSLSDSFKQIERRKEKEKSKKAPLMASNHIDQDHLDMDTNISKDNRTPKKEEISQRATDAAIEGKKNKSDNLQNKNRSAQATMITKIVVRFKNGEYELPSNYRKILFSELKKVAIDKDVFVTIDGHTDRRTTANFDNQRLSQQRADYVAVLLKQQGILGNHITARGHGDLQPLDSNDTPEAYEKNRRAEIKFFKDKP